MIIGDKRAMNEAISLINFLEVEMLKKHWNSITLCSAYLTEGAAESLIELINRMKVDRKLKVTILIGVKNHFTEPDAIKLLLNYIKINNKSNIEIALRLPKDTDFHLKCYIFIGQKDCKAIVGSANLTANGLNSGGELMVEVNDEKTIKSMVQYINYYLNNCGDWDCYINKYTTIYEKNKPKIIRVNTKRIFENKRVFGQKVKRTIGLTAPTMGILGKVKKEQELRVLEIFNKVQAQIPDIIKSNWVIYSEVDGDEIKDIKEKYHIGSWFDRPKESNDSWEIGISRMICCVGALVRTLDNEITMFMKKGCIHYIVSDEIIEAAEKFNIKSNDESYIPKKSELDKFKQYILNKRSY